MQTETRDTAILLGLALATLGVAATLGLLATEVWRRSPVNHVGYPPRTLCAVGIVGMMAAFVALYLRAQRCLALVCIAVSLILVVAVLAVDHWNVLVQYDEWLKRGMPESPL